jgi:hypothetical protein
MIWLEVRYQPQTVSTPEGVQYSVQAEVLSAGGIEREVFVYRLADDAYLHPALPFDMNTYPSSRAAAVAQGAEFYRAKHATRSFASSLMAAETLRVFKNHLRTLVRQWQATQTSPLGDASVEVYTSE